MTSEHQPSVGFIGLGIMGRPMARNLMSAGYRVVVADVVAEPVDTLVADAQLGAQGCRADRVGGAGSAAGRVLVRRAGPETFAPAPTRAADAVARPGRSPAGAEARDPVASEKPPEEPSPWRSMSL